jgi:hypothetical protein
MIATIIKKHSRNSPKCNAGHRREAIETAIFWVSRLTNRAENSAGISTMLVGNYEIEMTEETLVALHARLGDILADAAAYRKALAK